jgi:hypothetical protein
VPLDFLGDNGPHFPEDRLGDLRGDVGFRVLGDVGPLFFRGEGFGQPATLVALEPEESLLFRLRTAASAASVPFTAFDGRRSAFSGAISQDTDDLETR